MAYSTSAAAHRDRRGYPVKDCPVCKRPDVPDGLERCPQCNADLECFDLLDALQEPETSGARPLPGPPIHLEGSGPVASNADAGRGPQLANGKRAMLTAVLTIVPLVALGLAGGRYLGARIDRLTDRSATTPAVQEGPSRQERSLAATRTLTTRLAGLERQLARLGDRQASAGTHWKELRLGERLTAIEQRLQGLQQGVADLGQQRHTAQTEVAAAVSKPSALPTSPATAPDIPVSDFTEYLPLPDETLWGIARRFYGNGIYYPVLLEDNPWLAIHGTWDGRRIRIARERRQARERYRHLVVIRGGQTLFHYRAKSGDSWRSLARAFYGDESRAAELAALNDATAGGQPPPAGKRVLIPLD